MSRLNATFTLMKNYNIAQIKPLVDSAKTALITVPQMNVDSIGAALALALSLKKAGPITRVPAERVSAFW